MNIKKRRKCFFLDNGSSYSAENENSNGDNSECFEINLSTKWGIHPYIFKLEHEKQHSLVSELYFNKKQSPGGVLQ